MIAHVARRQHRRSSSTSVMVDADALMALALISSKRLAHILGASAACRRRIAPRSADSKVTLFLSGAISMLWPRAHRSRRARRTPAPSACRRSARSLRGIALQYKPLKTVEGGRSPPCRWCDLAALGRVGVHVIEMAEVRRHISDRRRSRRRAGVLPRPMSLKMAARPSASAGTLIIRS